MNTDNVWLQQKTLQQAAKKIACNFFPKPVRRDIYSTCLEVGPQLLKLYNREEHGQLWPWIFLNMMAVVDGKMCAMLILVVAESKIPWQQMLAIKCLQASRRTKESSTASRPKTSAMRATSMHHMCR
jgi:hypothetical protein